METNAFIVEKIDSFQSRTGWSDRQLGMAVAKDHRLIRRIRQGKATLRSISDVEEFMIKRLAEEAA